MLEIEKERKMQNKGGGGIYPPSAKQGIAPLIFLDLNIKMLSLIVIRINISSKLYEIEIYFDINST